jgi:DNA polymerase (family 10)
MAEQLRGPATADARDRQRLAEQLVAIERQNAKREGAVLLKSVEVDILEDGTLDLPSAMLAQLDLVVAAVHTNVGLPRGRQTERILKALESPFVTVLAHPLTRLLDARESYDPDMLKIVRKARERGVALELNAHPDRLGLTDVQCRMAKEEGVLVAISSAAHAAGGLDGLQWGVGQARRGWLEARDVLNAKSLDALRAWLEGRRPRA